MKEDMFLINARQSFRREPFKFTEYLKVMYGLWVLFMKNILKSRANYLNRSLGNT